MPQNPLNIQDHLSPQELTAAFQQALQLQPPDAGLLLDLSARLASQDPNYVRFSVDAGLIDRLGRELVTRQETAVSELIKNAYDADATSVDMRFEETAQSNGTLTITDNGSGMTREELVSGFMRLSSTEKVREPISPLFGRQRAGRKGIGRFAVQRLGQKLEIVTQTREADHALRVIIDWSQFVSGIELGSIANRIEEVKRRAEHGTTLIISELREPWREAALKRVYRSISELIQPITLRKRRASGPQDATKPISDLPVIGSEGTEFQISIQHDKGEKQEIIDETTEVLQHALAVMEGFVDENGNGFWSCESKSLELKETIQPIGYEREKPDLPFPTLRNVDFKVHYFIFKAGFISKAVHKSIQGMAELRGGIRLYRNGLRVASYGEPGDDWLGLEASSRNRDILPPHANYNFFGFVEIYDQTGEIFEETADREELLEDHPAYVELRDFVYRSLVAGVTRIAEVRGRKVKASQTNWEKKSKPSETLQPAADALNQALQDAENSVQAQEESENNEAPVENPGDIKDPEITLPLSVVKSAATSVGQAIEQSKAQEDEHLQEIGMLRILSSLGLVIGEFTHEVKQTLGSATLNAGHLQSEITPGGRGERILSDLSSNLKRFNQYVSYFDRTIREKNHRQLEPQDLRRVVEEWVETVRSSAEKARIQIDPPILDDDWLLSCPMHAAECASILFNFYSNACKAIARAESAGRIQISVQKVRSHLVLEFSDNGDGVLPENTDRVFDVFFTTSTPASSEADEQDSAQGNGLGLKIVQDIVHSYGGNIELVDAPAGFNTCFKVTLPAATEEEADAYIS